MLKKLDSPLKSITARNIKLKVFLFQNRFSHVNDESILGLTSSGANLALWNSSTTVQIVCSLRTPLRRWTVGTETSPFTYILTSTEQSTWTARSRWWGCGSETSWCCSMAPSHSLITTLVTVLFVNIWTLHGHWGPWVGNLGKINVIPLRFSALIYFLYLYK